MKLNSLRLKAQARGSVTVSVPAHNTMQPLNCQTRALLQLLGFTQRGCKEINLERSTWE